MQRSPDLSSTDGQPEPRLAAVRSLRLAQSEGRAAPSGASEGGKGGSGGGAADPSPVLQQVEEWLKRPHRWSAAGAVANGGGAGGTEADGGAAGLARSLDTAASSLNHAVSRRAGCERMGA